MLPLPRAPLALLAASLLASGAAAQTLWTLDTSGAVPLVHELAWPSDPLQCGFPAPSPLTTFPATVSGSCGGFLTNADGDLTVDRANGILYVGLGQRVARYTFDGTFLDSFSIPISVHGMCINPNTGRIWVSDFAVYAAFDPPPIPSCQASVSFSTGPYLIPYAAAWFPSQLTDLDFDPTSRSLIGCDRSGVVGSFLPSPIPARGPYGFFQVSPTCSFSNGPTGIALDFSRPGQGVFWVTDGTTIAYLQPGGAPASPTPYAPVTCMTAPVGFLAGLTYTARPVPYGQGSDTAGLTPPTIGAVGEAVHPNPNFAFTLQGSVPGGAALLVYGKNGLACPSYSVGGMSLLVQQPLQCLGIAPVDATGSALLATPVAATVPTRFTGWVQWLVATPTGSLQTSNAMQLTFAVP